ncbi:hypothetical protein CRYUN_Cryun15aG0053000 [Craigia yunnanensis]
MTLQEYLNMKHSQARNCIERCFGILKARWAILREKSFYPVKTQCKIIFACCLLHNFIRSKMPIDPIEKSVGDVSSSQPMGEGEKKNLIRHCETTNAWIEFRDKLAEEIFTSWMGSNS